MQTFIKAVVKTKSLQRLFLDHQNDSNPEKLKQSFQLGRSRVEKSADRSIVFANESRLLIDL